MNPTTKKRKANDGKAIDDTTNNGEVVAREAFFVPSFQAKKQTIFAQIASAIFLWFDGMFKTRRIADPESQQARASRTLQRACELYNRPIGTVVVMGSNTDGQLAKPPDERIYLPTIPSSLQSTRFIQIVAGAIHTAALTIDGRVFTWGDNQEMALARPDEPIEPTEVKGFYNGVESEEGQIVAIAAGGSHTVFLTINGNVFVAGSYKDHKDHSWRMPSAGHFPLHIALPQKARAIFSGETFSAAILADHSMVTWGVGINGQLARKTVMAARDANGTFVAKSIKKLDDKYVRETFLTPKPVVFESTIPKIVETVACGGHHMLVVARDVGSFIPRVYSSGLNNSGQLGLGSTSSMEVHKLTVIPYFDDKYICKVAAGFAFSLALDMHGVCLYSFGSGNDSQLGLLLDDESKARGFVASPQLVAFPGSEPVRIEDIWAGGRIGMAIGYKGDIYTWGSGAGPTGHSDDLELGFSRPTKLSLNLGQELGHPIVHQASGGDQHVGMIVSFGREKAMDV